MTKFDKALIISVFLLAAGLYILHFLPHSSTKLHLLVSIKGETICDWVLSEHNGEHLPLSLDGGTTEVIINNGKVVLRSDTDFCPKKICVHNGEISRSGQTIICAPNHLLIKLSAENSKIDAISR